VGLFKQEFQLYKVMETLIGNGDIVGRLCLPAVDIGFEEDEMGCQVSFSSKLFTAREHLGINIQAMEHKIVDTPLVK
jgi:hypothetical protein